MIQIKRCAGPSVLMGTTKSGNHYKRPEVVTALFKMQHKKCCYCEQKVPEEGHSRAVEHFRPKARYPHLKNAWDNLLLACSKCNGKKWNHFPEDDQGNPLLIDPSDPHLDPEDHLDFIVDDEDDFFGMTFPKNNSIVGDKTIQIIGLYLSYYRTERMKYYKELYVNYLDIVNAPDSSSRTACINKFESLLYANSEFAAFARKFARVKKLDQKYGVRIPVGSEVFNPH